jgi:signal transduction histidine kinase
VRSYLAAPVISRSGEVLGGLFFGHATPGVFNERDEIAITTVAAQAAIAIDNAHLYRAEQKARRNAEEALRVRDAFLSIASHELKTPVTAVSLQLQSLRREADRDELSVERPRGKLASAERAINRLTGLVDELLDVSRLTAGRLEIAREAVDLAEVVDEVVARCDLLAKSTGSVVVAKTSPALALADRQRIDQVLSNLLSNAIKYGDSKPIEVSCGVEDSRVVVRVRDGGIGIAPDARDRIFERFERAVEARSFSGLGLGLWITKSLVHLMDGDIAVESELGVGSTFTARFPQYQMPAVTPQPK